MSSKSLFALVVVAAVAAGAAYKFLPRQDRNTPASKLENPTAGTVEGTPEGLSKVAPERVEPPEAVAAKSAADGGRKDAAGETPARRKVTEAEKESVRELMKLHNTVAQGQGEAAVSSVPSEIPGTDGDSLFLKYGSFDRTQITNELESLEAILVWQNEGPFESKELEILSPELVRTFEIEIEWLRERLAEM